MLYVLRISICINKLVTKILKKPRTWTDSLDKRHIGYWRESQKERDHWEDQDVGGWTILKWILERWDGVDWMDMAQEIDQWRALVNTVLNLRVP
jgi:hypothetical protein